MLQGAFSLSGREKKTLSHEGCKRPGLVRTSSLGGGEFKGGSGTGEYFKEQKIPGATVG